MKKLEQWFNGITLVLCIILDCILFPFQKLFGFEIFQLSLLFIRYVEKKKY